ncbi:dihydrofolate reductase family protein [Specibacter cremeus]|uniref:dihydrofolate reductase family protein n=1 Tax=Specibacter cremeus TaxID=1629051 RepID=UPI000F796722|nr:dihydrofolate reductase family protein [Specibacter cremeus]
MGIVTAGIAISLDGFAAGPNQTREKPFGDGIDGRLHTWMFDHADENAAEVAALTSAGAYVMGRNMFGPDRSAWDLDWRGWWGPNPPYHAPVFVLAHRPRDTVAMDGGTTFEFVTDGIDSALARARAAAGDQDVAIAGGASTINQYLAAGLIDELRLHVVPITVGVGERLFPVSPQLTLEPVSVRQTPHVTHLVYRRPTVPG